MNNNYRDLVFELFDSFIGADEKVYLIGLEHSGNKELFINEAMRILKKEIIKKEELDEIKNADFDNIEVYVRNRFKNRYPTLNDNDMDIIMNMIEEYGYDFRNFKDEDPEELDMFLDEGFSIEKWEDIIYEDTEVNRKIGRVGKVDGTWIYDYAKLSCGKYIIHNDY